MVEVMKKFKMIDVGLLWPEIVDEVLAHHGVGVAGVVMSSLQGYRLKSSASSQMDWCWNSSLGNRLEGRGVCHSHVSVNVS